MLPTFLLIEYRQSSFGILTRFLTSLLLFDLYLGAKIVNFPEIQALFLFYLVIWRIFIWLFGRIPFGHLARRFDFFAV